MLRLVRSNGKSVPRPKKPEPVKPDPNSVDAKLAELEALGFGYRVDGYKKLLNDLLLNARERSRVV